ncbi:MAG: hypothetical protein ACJAVV_001654 [Alphaproteobacteria bacterium]|jgi:hypothetical protein
MANIALFTYWPVEVQVTIHTEQKDIRALRKWWKE